MTTDGAGTVSVSKRIEAPAAAVFALLREPGRHPVFDGSGMLLVASEDTAISAVGDVFVMKMHNDRMGDYEMTNHVVEYVQDRRIVWEPVLSAATRDEDRNGVGHSARQRWGYELEPDGSGATVVTELFDCSRSPEWLRSVLKGGDEWLPAMTASLDLLDRQCRSEPEWRVADSDG